jgi:hypothetical protein
MRYLLEGEMPRFMYVLPDDDEKPAWLKIVFLRNHYD